jgi:hypothetical protein
MRLGKVPLFGNLLATPSVILLKKEVLENENSACHTSEICERATRNFSTPRRR